MAVTRLMITNISPQENWFTNNTGSGRAKAAVNHYWQEDSLATPAANAVVEGSEATAEAASQPTLKSNHCQIVRKTFQVSDTTQAVTFAGRRDEKARLQVKKTKELANDIEYALVINATAVTGESGTARQLKGVLGWVTTNVTTATATSEELSESRFNDNLGLIWAQGGTPRVTLVGAFNKRKISGFTSNTRDISAEAKKLVNTVNMYQSDFGDIMVRLHHVINTEAPGTVLNLGMMDLWKKAWLRPVVPVPLAKTGSSTKMMIEAELTLESLQEKGSGKMTGFYTG